MKNDIYSVDQAVLTGLASVASPSGCISASLWEDKESGRYFYSLSNGGEQVVLPSQIGIITQNIDFSCGAEYVPGEVRDVTDSYTLLSGKRRGKVEHSCREYSFVLKKDGARADEAIAACRGVLADESIPWEAAALEEKCRALAEPLEMKLKNLLQPLRVAICGNMVSPPLFESIELMKREDVLARIDAVVGLVF